METYIPLINENYPIVNLDDFADTKLTPLQRAQIDDLGLSLEIINRRYHNLTERCKLRNAPKPNRYKFIRALLYILAKTSVSTTKKPSEILDTYNIHSIDRHSYCRFQLLPQNVHRKLHSKSKLPSLFRCKYCNELKTKNNFVKNVRTFTGIELTCKKCKYKAKKELKEIKGATNEK